MYGISYFNGVYKFYKKTGNSSVETSTVSKIKVYPQPASEFLVIEGYDLLDNPENLIIYNLQGQIMQEHRLSNFNLQDKIFLNISNLNPGFYNIKLNNITYKFIKK